MGTRNFSTANYDMPLVIGGLLDFDELKESYEEYNEEEYTKWMFEDDLWFDCDNAQWIAKNFTEGLKYHEIEVEGGYYYGYQFQVYERMGYKGTYEMDELDNEDCHQYYGECRSKVARKVKSEKNKIRKWLKELVKDYGYTEIECVGVFSNGEAVYREVK